VDDAALVLRPAHAADAELVLELRNDAEARRQSFSAQPIAAAEHDDWFRDRLARPEESRIYIAETDGLPVGQARVDRLDDGAGEISVALAGGARGRGLGRELIALASARGAQELGLHELRAFIKSGNVASQRAFEAVGYTLAREVDKDGATALVYVWHAA
jgi:RimJ/RimL family protein N-acetyltransferase